jgi:hypothetical protein
MSPDTMYAIGHYKPKSFLSLKRRRRAVVNS